MIFLSATTCGEPEAVHGALKQVHGHNVGDRVSYTCIGNRKFSTGLHHAVSICTVSGRWFPSQGNCETGEVFCSERQKAVAAYLKSEKLLLFGYAWQYVALIP